MGHHPPVQAASRGGGLWRCIVHGLITAEDDSETVTRKYILIFGLVLGVIMCALNISLLPFVLAHDTAMRIALPLTMVIVCPLWLGLYLYCRRTKQCPRHLIDIWVFGLLFYALVMSISSRDVPVTLLCALALEIASLVRTLWLPLHSFLTLLIFFIDCWNRSFLHDEDPPQIYIPNANANNSSSFAMFITQFIGGCLVLLGAFTFSNMQSRNHAVHLDHAKNSVRMASEVAVLLKQYDTVGVRQTLLRYREAGTCDEGLIVSLQDIVENLERYRPHLPNWLLMVREEEDTATRDADERRTLNSYERHSSELHTGVHRSPMGMEQTKSLDESGSVSTSPLAVINGSNFSANPMWYGKVTFARLRCNVRLPDYQGAAALAQREMATTAAVDRVYEVAAETKGSVYSLVGDMVLAAWNATARVVQPELKGARFMARLRENSGHATITFTGGAMTGPAYCFVAGSSDRSQTPTVSMEWRGALRTMSDLGEQHNTMLIDQPTIATAQFEIETRAVDTLTTATGCLIIHEVVAERAASDEEWLYVLQGVRDNPNSLVTQALHSVVEGDRDSAKELLDRAMEDEDVAMSSMVQKLRRRTLAFAGSSNSPTNLLEQVSVESP